MCGTAGHYLLFIRMETNSVFEGMLDMVVVGTAVFFTR